LILGHGTLGVPSLSFCDEEKRRGLRSLVHIQCDVTRNYDNFKKVDFQLKRRLVEEVFGNHSSTSQIDLHGNPYTCDCHLMPLFDWLKTTRARLVNKVSCNILESNVFWL